MPLKAGEIDVYLYVRPTCSTPPERVTGLAAVTDDYQAGGSEGRVKLSWTAPITHPDDAEVLGYWIKWSTTGLAYFINDTTAWWEWEKADGVQDYTFLNESGDFAEYTVGGLTPGSTYYFSIKARDEFGNDSDIDMNTFLLDQAYAKASIDDIAPNAVTDLVALSGPKAYQVSLLWTAPGDDGTYGAASKYYVRYATFSAEELGEGTSTWWLAAEDAAGKSPVVNPGAQGDEELYTITGLTQITTYYFSVRSEDERGNLSDVDVYASAMAQAEAASPDHDINPEAVGNLNAAAVPGKVQALLTWAAPDDGYGSAVSSYLIRYATFSVAGLSGNTTLWWDRAKTCGNAIVPSAPGAAQQFTVVNLKKETPYYFGIRSYNRLAAVSPMDLKSRNSVQDRVYIEEKPDKIRPDQPPGFRLGKVKRTGEVTLIWKKVRLNEDGTEYKDHKLYRVMRSNRYDGDWTEIYSTTKDEKEYSWEDETAKADRKVRYYKVQAVDLSGNRSDSTTVLEASAEPKIIVEDTGGGAKLEIPLEDSGILYSESNDYRADLVLEIKEKAAEEPAEIARYRFRAVNSKNGRVEDSVYFASPFRLSISYGKTSWRGAPVSDIAEDGQAEDLSLYWFNGIEWIKIGGEVDEDEETVSVYARALGEYSLRADERSDTFDITAIHPDKIFTPKSEYMNFIEFKYDNPKNADIEGEIFDIRGAYVSDMSEGFTASSVSGSLMWDGRDTDDNYVSGGVYIYMITVSGSESKVMTGTIVIAR
ncbi:MAG: hypothetical protein JXJ19_00955 [Elusimicrobia bacterium]|nr:hypothetical protein [Elusimicrobiota bacterium]